MDGRCWDLSSCLQISLFVVTMTRITETLHRHISRLINHFGSYTFFLPVGVFFPHMQRILICLIWDILPNVLFNLNFFSNY
uniref:Uncharacterized protein n=1 Tax=Fundulus heteroclitus TaxID=8078 RepID=A0A3Q2UIA1_FUNHE